MLDRFHSQSIRIQEVRVRPIVFREMDMSGRALILATAMLLIGLAAPSSLIAPASAQNLEAGKSPGQLFAGNCSVCHKSARGLLKSVAPGNLPSFLRQHYTTSADMAKIMSSYVIANGAGVRAQRLVRPGEVSGISRRPGKCGRDLAGFFRADRLQQFCHG